MSDFSTIDDVHVSEMFGDRDDAPPANFSFPPTWRLLDDVELMTLPDPEWMVDNLIPRRSVGVLYAPSGAAKTTFAAKLKLSLATRTDFFGHRVLHQGSSVYVGAEDPAGFKKRLEYAKRAARVPLDQAVGIYTFPEAIDLRDSDKVRAFTRFVKSVAYRQRLELVTVDTYAAAMPGATENSSEDTGLAMAHAHMWREALDATVLLIHHTNAGGTRERGHSAMRGAADFMISITPVDDVLHVEVNKQRNGPTGETFTLRLVPLPDCAGVALRLAQDVIKTDALSAQQEKVLAVLRSDFSAADGATKSDWLSSCTDVPSRTFHRAAKVLLERGYVTKVGSYFRARDQQ